MKQSIDVTHPKLISEWHPRNPPISNYSRGSDKRVWWRCELNHEWETSPYNRTSNNSRCPYCAGKKAIIGVNDLATLRPDIVIEWHPDNIDEPSCYKEFSSKKVLWLCQYGHSWESTIANRTAGGNGCPHCAGKPSSQIEIDVLCSFSRYTEVRARQKICDVEVDIFLPELNYIIEYDGYCWHQNRQKEDTIKSSLLIEGGFNVHRFRETKLENLDINYPNYSQSTFKWTKDMKSVDLQVDEWFLSKFYIPKRN